MLTKIIFANGFDSVVSIDSFGMTSNSLFYSCINACIRYNSVILWANSFNYAKYWARIFLFISLFGFCISLLGLFLSFRSRIRSIKSRKHSHDICVQNSEYRKCPKNEWPSVTILRPLKGLDDNLRKNLISSFKQDYPKEKLEIILAVADTSDPCIPLAEELIKEFGGLVGHVDLIVGEMVVGANPKINNLMQGYTASRHEILWICDSNICSASETLKNSVLQLQIDRRVGLVHHLPVAENPQSFGALLECVFLNTFHARSYLSANFMAPVSCVTGKSTMFRKLDIETLGGLSAFANSICEDNLIGKAILEDLKLSHVLTTDRAVQSLGAMSIGAFFSRRLRWIRIRKYSVFYVILLEPFFEALSLSGMFAWAISRFFPISVLSGFLAYFTCLLIIDSIVFRNISLDTSGRLVWPLFALVWLIREITSLPLFFVAVMGNTIEWRNVIYTLLPGGYVGSIRDTSQNSLKTCHKSSRS